jgi:serine/threonine protein kinase
MQRASTAECKELRNAMEEMTVRLGDVVLGKYHVESMLGRGGMGVVMAVRNLDLDALFAIKLLIGNVLDDEDAGDRFWSEARRAARLQSEHSIRILDVGHLDTGAPYMIMEHLTGSNLKKLIRTNGPLPVEQAVTYVLQACDAMSEAHSLGIIHRDLKPSNLFLTQRRDGSPCVKVLDFGISKQQTPDDPELTKSGMVLGSPSYMPPEQMAHARNADVRSDVWSMGTVLYELVTATLPFRGATMAEMIAHVLQAELRPPSQVQPGLPAALDAVVMRCLQKNPDDRYQSIDELAAALRQLLATSATAAVSTKALSLSVDMSQPAPLGASQASAKSTPGSSTGWVSTMRQRRLWAGGKLVAVASVVIGITLLGSSCSSPMHPNASSPSEIAPPRAPRTLVAGVSEATPAAPEVTPASPAPPAVVPAGAAISWAPHQPHAAMPSPEPPSAPAKDAAARKPLPAHQGTLRPAQPGRVTPDPLDKM